MVVLQPSQCTIVDLGLQSLVGLECVGYVERDEYCSFCSADD